MSTLKVSNINHASASTGGLAIDSSGVVTGALPSPNRNLLYNGAMQVAQRGTSTTGITAGGYNTVDRWTILLSGLGTWTQDIQDDAPTGSGFRRSLRMLCTTADAAPAANDVLAVRQILEGQDVQRVRKGTSSAQKLTLSFWVKSNVTGTYIADIYDNDNTRFVAASYTISASATWERKTITFPADTTGAFDNDNAASLYVDFFLGAGSTYTSGTLQTTWASYTAANNTPGQTNLAAATNNYWQITGVQLEVGDTATEFEFKSYGQELAECQRYYYRLIYGISESLGIGVYTSASDFRSIVSFPVSMRSAPSLVSTSGTNYYAAAGASTDYHTSVFISQATTRNAAVRNNTEMSGTAGYAANHYTGEAAAFVAFNAEL